MTRDDDLSAILPEPPPPAPKPREAAMAAALARFDGAPAPARDPRPERAPWWRNLHRPQAGLLAAAALVVAIGLPFALKAPVPLAPAADERVSPVTNDAAPPVAQEVAAAPKAIPAVKPLSTKADATRVDTPPSRSDDVASDDVASTAKRIEIALAAPAPPPPPPPPALRAGESAAIVVRGRAVSQTLQELPVAISGALSEEGLRDSTGSIVVTGARIAPSKPAGRGDWNACTVNDPNRILSRCNKLAAKAEKAVRSQAGTHLSDGLKQAWGGDLDKAIAAFNAAIAIAPGLSAAYLNRGLAYDRQGDSEAAIADLDRAVRLAPKSARAYYNRSVLLRKYGDPNRASADEQQAINLDPRYRAVLR